LNSRASHADGLGGTETRCSIVIPVYNRASLTRQCLDALFGEHRPAVTFEVVVVDDGSTDTTGTMLEAYREVRVLRHDRSLGFAHAVNAGAAAASAEFLVFLNNDTIPEPGWLDALVAQVEEHPRAAVVGSRLLYPNDTVQHAGIVITQEHIPRHIYLGFPGDHPAVLKSRRFRAVTGACALFRRELFEAAGGFDVGFTNGYEDIDICLRFGEAGYEIHYCAESVLVHLEKATRGLGADEAGHDLFVKRWPNLQPDDLHYYLADGLIRIEYRDHYPIEVTVSPELAVVNTADEDREVDRLLSARAQQVFDLLQENTRLKLGDSRPGEGTTNGEGSREGSLSQKAVLFLSGSPGDTMRYRCEHQAEALRMVGATADVRRLAGAHLDEVLNRYEVFVLHRVAFGKDLEWFLQHARLRGKVVVFDTDDLVFDENVMRHVAATADMSVAERAMYEHGLSRYRETLRRCDAVIVTTEPLCELARLVHDDVYVVPNAVSAEMVAGAEAAVAREGSHDGIVIGYLSGTKTHDRDFLEASDAVLDALAESDSISLLIVGHLKLDKRFDEFRDRIEQLPIQRWQALPRILRGMDVNLAPLEQENPFTESKSCIKYLEAGLVGVPTVASARADYTRVIEQGRNGLVADTPAEWKAALSDLTRSRSRREKIGTQARLDVVREHTTAARAPLLLKTMREIAATKVRERPLRVNWVLLAPIAQTSGGYRNVFRIAEHLGRNGHDVHAYVSPVAHLEGMSDKDVVAFVESSFQLETVKVEVDTPVGTRRRMRAADVSIATYWTTAYDVAADPMSLFKAYYIQDFEPDFFDEADPAWNEALETYSLPLRQICLGKSLSTMISDVGRRPTCHVDFALDTEFRMTIDPSARGERPSVLFFARPSLKRRGYQLGVEALALVKARIPDLDVVFFGSPSEELEDVPFDSRNLGVLSPADLADAMNHADVLLTFSLSNISNVPFEGMACGCAVIEADLPQVREMVEPGVDCLVAPTNPEGVADVLERLVTDADMRLRVAHAGNEKVRGWTWERTASQFESHLLETCFTRFNRRVASSLDPPPRAAATVG
jgi:GT2 family glycosyltransferase/glycosyltransferase involved in cell wall biosynthesis